MTRTLSDEDRATLVYSGSSAKDLWPIAEALGWLSPEERQWATERLIEHPMFTPEVLDVSLHHMCVMSFGDDVVEMQTAIRALEAARDAAADDQGRGHG